MTSLLETKSSSLILYNIHNESLLESTKLECVPLLFERPEVVVYNKVVKQARNVGFFSNSSAGYMYSGKLMPAKPIGSSLSTLLQEIELISGNSFNGVLVNQYKDGNDNIGKHSDDESNLMRTSGVVTVSFGATRTFRIRNRKTDSIVLDIEVKSGDILHMKGNFQREFTHELPVRKRIKDERISFTFRNHID